MTTSATRRSREVLAIRLPLEERARIERLAAELGTSRSRVLRAAFCAAERGDRDVLALYLARLPAGSSGGPEERT